MKIAVLGWGSLIWDPRELMLAENRWHQDGPPLPIEFARISGGGHEPQRLTLVLRNGAAAVRTLWARSAFQDLDRARKNLAIREKTTRERIGYVKGGDLRPLADRSRLTALINTKLASVPSAGTRGEELQRKTEELLLHIDQWRTEHGFDAVIWTDLPSNFEDRHRDGADHPILLTPDGAVGYLNGLIGTDAATAAEEYVRRAPSQVRTAIRDYIEVALGWVPLPTSAVTNTDDPRFKEWAECRTTIGRFDTILLNLRKAGFAFITALITASAFLILLGFQTSQNVPAPPAPARAAPFLAIMVLIAALFFVDNHYDVMLRGVVERALDLETQMDPPLRVPRYISISTIGTQAVAVTRLLYLLLLVIACGLGLLRALGSMSSGTSSTSSFSLGPWNMMATVVSGVGGSLGALMVGYTVFIAWKTEFHVQKAGRRWRTGWELGTLIRILTSPSIARQFLPLLAVTRRGRVTMSDHPKTEAAGANSLSRTPGPAREIRFIVVVGVQLMLAGAAGLGVWRLLDQPPNERELLLLVGLSGVVGGSLGPLLRPLPALGPLDRSGASLALSPLIYASAGFGLAVGSLLLVTGLLISGGPRTVSTLGTMAFGAIVGVVAAGIVDGISPWPREWSTRGKPSRAEESTALATALGQLDDRLFRRPLQNYDGFILATWHASQHLSPALGQIRVRFFPRVGVEESPAMPAAIVMPGETEPPRPATIARARLLVTGGIDAEAALFSVSVIHPSLVTYPRRVMVRASLEEPSEPIELTAVSSVPPEVEVDDENRAAARFGEQGEDEDASSQRHLSEEIERAPERIHARTGEEAALIEVSQQGQTIQLVELPINV